MIVSCAVISINPITIDQLGATLSIKGILPIDNETISFDSSSSMLTWSPPSLIPSKYHQELLYKIGFSVKHDEFVLPTTDDTFILLDNITICDVVNVTISVISGIYSSIGANKLIVYSNYNETVITLLWIIFNHSNNEFEVTFNIRISDDNIVCQSTIQGCSEEKNFVDGATNYFKHKSLQINSANDVFTTVNYSISVNESQSYYSFYVNVYDSVGLLKYTSDSWNFSTYYVQNISVGTEGDFVCVECTFLYQAISDGCFIEMRETTSDKVVKSFKIAKFDYEITTEKCVAFSTSGNYTITAYDIIDNIVSDAPSTECFLSIPVKSVTSINVTTFATTFHIVESSMFTVLPSSSLVSATVPSNIFLMCIIIIGVIICAITLCTAINTILCIASCRKRRCGLKSVNNENIETQNNEAYAVVKLEFVPMSKNSAYQNVTEFINYENVSIV